MGHKLETISAANSRSSDLGGLLASNLGDSDNFVKDRLNIYQRRSRAAFPLIPAINRRPPK